MQVYTLLISIVLLTIAMNMISHNSKDAFESKQVHSLAAKQLTHRLQKHISSDSAWESTTNPLKSLACNSSAACIASKTDCSKEGLKSEDKIFRCLYTTDGNQLFFDGRDSTAGFTVDGERCNSYEKLGDKNCIYRPTFTWEANCGSDCSKQKVEVKIRLHMSNQVQSGINLEFASITLEK